jgi:hypothetical protein
LTDNNHVVVSVNFTGAPAAPDPASVYQGSQIIIVRANGTKFPNGDPWRCLTCSIPAANSQGADPDIRDYPQTFNDGLRILAGYNVLQSQVPFQNDNWSPNTTHVYPLRWNTAANGSGPGGSIRELRLHPDSVHLGFNALTISANGVGETSYFSRLSFNPSPSTGTPLVPRYDLVNVTQFADSKNPGSAYIKGDTLVLNSSAIGIVGEFRGFTGKGDEMLTIATIDSGNYDIIAIDLQNGQVRRITERPGYADPIGYSYDGRWSVILDTRATNRTFFLDGMRHVPPVADLVSGAFAASIRNNGPRRFFQPFLFDNHGDCGSYGGQQINAGDGKAGSPSDPNWNALADPRWSWDGTKVIYHQALVVSPHCGGSNPLPCPVSTAQGGRNFRLMLATLTSRKPKPYQPIAPVSDAVPWGTPYVPGGVGPSGGPLPGGNFTLYGSASGYAKVSLFNNTKGAITSVAATYFNFSNDGCNYLSGSESVTTSPLTVTNSRFDWYSNLTVTGEIYATKVTGPGGWHASDDVLTNIFQANGTLVTTVNGVSYYQPVNGG